jgi:amidase
MDYLTIDEAQDGFARDTFTCQQLVGYYLHRIEHLSRPLTGRDGNDQTPGLGPRINAIITVSETALQDAEDLDDYYREHGNFKGPLHGIPIIVKDNIATAGIFTTYGSIKAKDNIPTEDATVITKLKDAGAIILAKSALAGECLGR